ncbi:hypothetical protein NQ317_018944, partial [Molorchus minor]
NRYFLLLVFHSLVILGLTLADNEATTTTTTAPQPIYKPPEQPQTYVPLYPYSDSYGNSLYDALFYQPSVPYKPPQAVETNYVSAVVPAAQGALQFILHGLAKFGLFLIGGVALLVVGGIFTTAVCALTPICDISFPIFGGIDKESMRSTDDPGQDICSRSFEYRTR